MPRVPGNRHHVVDGDVFGEEVEEVAGSRQASQALFDDLEERIERREVREVGDGCLRDAPLLADPGGVDARHDAVRRDAHAPQLLW
jgi:hypothetical protein